MSAQQTSKLELALIFLRLGTTAFGGPAAHIAMMKTEFVDRRGWLTEQEFLDLVGASNLIPGPSSTELAIHIGVRQAGWAGLWLAGICFILPAALIVTLCAWAYIRFGHLPQAAGVLYGVKPVMIAVIGQALWSLGRTALKTRALAMFAVCTTILAACGVSPLLLLFGAGSLTALEAGAQRGLSQDSQRLLSMTIVAGLLAGIPLAISLYQPPMGVAPSPFSLFWVFAKIGSVLYGSGYVLLAFLRTELVTRLHWMTNAQILDSTAVGQFTPGPVFTTATFIGYLLAGPKGAFMATVGIFLPAFIFVAISGPLILRVKESNMARGFLNGVNVASLSLMAAATWQLALASLIDLRTIIIVALSALLLVRFRVNSAWVVLGGALAGLAALR